MYGLTVVKLHMYDLLLNSAGFCFLHIHRKLNLDNYIYVLLHYYKQQNVQTLQINMKNVFIITCTTIKSQ